MIERWFKKHRWMNETLKLVASLGMTYFAIGFYLAIFDERRILDDLFIEFYLWMHYVALCLGASLLIADVIFSIKAMLVKRMERD